jgi:predicted 3-demethylubiquinone-9 3-methyltransferase (glyoxalase superfamily)
MQKISPFLWFDNQAEEAAKLYASAFGDSAIGRVARYGDSGPGPKGEVMTIGFRLQGLELAALNGGPVFKFSPATSLFVSCETADEADVLWRKLSDGGKVLMELQKYPFSEKFGWVADKYGLSWQLNVGGRGKKITPFLMFVGSAQGKAEEAIRSYVSVFKSSRVDQVERYGTGEPGTPGTVKHARFTLDGCEFMAMDSNGPHDFTFTPALSFFVNCETQAEIDEYWEKLSDGGKTGQCGWLDDRYGVSWQIVPSIMGELMSDGDAKRSGRVMDVMLKMNKLDIAALEKAYAG